MTMIRIEIVHAGCFEFLIDWYTPLTYTFEVTKDRR